MITNIYYYEHYKPYILNKEEYSFNISSFNFEKQYFMNTALNDNIKSYMFEISVNFNGLKCISNNLKEKLSIKYTSENINSDIKRDIKNFTRIYNNFIGFLDENYQNCSQFSYISKNFKNFIKNNEKLLNYIGIKISNQNFLFINNEENFKYIEKNKEHLKNFYSKIYNFLCKFMKQPMTKYMLFKDFSFYFNYDCDFEYKKDKSFRIVSQGVLFDYFL